MKKKGFTLIELLAVIIILAVIALIAAPVVLNIIEQVKIKGAESSAKGYAKAVEYEILNDTMFKGKNLDGEYDVEENVLEVVYQGNGPSEGYFVIENNIIKYGEFCINGYGIKYENSIGKYSPDEVTCNGGNEIVFVEPEGVACTDIENYDEETNFKIKTVEDLVCVSNLSKSGKTFSGKTVMLLSDIDIKDSNSYNDINNTTYGDINGNGTVEGIQVELTTGSGFNPIGSSSVPFSGTFEGYGFTLSNLMINRSGNDNVGLFGYVTNGTIKGFSLINYDITGASNVGGIVGFNDYGNINEVLVSGSINSTSSYSGGVAGYNSYGNVKNAIVKNIENNQVEYRAGGIVGQAFYGNVTGIVEKGNIKSKEDAGIIMGYNGYATVNAYGLSNVSVIQNASVNPGVQGTLISENHKSLSTYDNVIDTYIGGDNDSSGYYFDYDKNNEIVIKNVEREPITFTLKGNGTEESPYLINNYQQWREATTKVDSYYKLNNIIDFSNKNFYMLGTTSNKFTGHLEGNGKTLLNIDIVGFNNTGLIGYNNGGIIEDLYVKNISIIGNTYVGGIAGYNKGKVIGITADNINITGLSNVGGIVGYNDESEISDIIVSANIETTSSYTGGVVGYNNYASTKNIIVKDININSSEYRAGGIVGQAFYGNVTGIVEKGSIKSKEDAGIIMGYNGYATVNAYGLSDVSVIQNASANPGVQGTLISENHKSLSTYDNVIDTYIGGDNDSNGYYFDYEGNEIVIRNIKRNPITFKLAGNGTEENPYIINNYQDWREATTKLDSAYHYKLNSDIDFSNKKFYMLGTSSNIFTGVLDGNNKTLSNIVINGHNNTGIVAYNKGTIKGLNIINATVYGNDNVGIITGTNESNVYGINIYNSKVFGSYQVGLGIGYNSGTVKEMSIDGEVNSTQGLTGGIVGYNYYGNATSVLVRNIVVNNNAYRSGGIVGQAFYGNVTGIVEKGSINSNEDAGKIMGYNGYATVNAYGSNNVNINQSASYNPGQHGTSYDLYIPNTVSYTENNNRVEIDSLSYYNNIGMLDTVINGDDDNSGYYLNYGSNNKIIVVPAGTSTNPGGGNTGTTGSVEIDSNYTMTQINGTTDTTAPTCELYYVRAVSNGIQASFSCTDDSGVPTLRSLFDSTTSKSAQTFDNIGTLKNGSVSGNTKTVVSTWNVNNAISQPTPGTCYYFRYGAKDAQNNFSTYVTNVCYKGFSE